MRAFLVVGIVSVALYGCGVVPPKVQYSDAQIAKAADGSLDESGTFIFRQRRSVIQVKFNADKKAFEASALPFELNSDDTYRKLFGIKGRDDYRSTTQLKVSYLDNTKFIDQLQVTTKDNIADTISKVGEALKTIAPLLATAVSGSATDKGAPAFEPTIIDPTWADIENWKRDNVNPTYCVRLRAQAVESSITMEEYLSATREKWVSTFPVPACATGVVEMLANCQDADMKSNAKTPQISTRVTFASSDHVLPIALPSTGSLKMNSICGASVTIADKEDRYDLLNYLNSGIKQAQETYSAWSKAKKEKK